MTHTLLGFEPCDCGATLMFVCEGLRVSCPACHFDAGRPQTLSTVISRMWSGVEQQERQDLLSMSTEELLRTVDDATSDLIK